MRLSADIHLCLVSGKITANLTPLLNRNTRPKQVVLLYPQEMAESVDGLVRVIAAVDGVSVSCRVLSNSRNAQAVRKTVLEVLNSCAGQEVALNASGGNRLLSLVASEVFHDLNKPVFYVDTCSDRLIPIYPHDDQDYQLGSRVSVQQYLAICGFEVQENSERIPHASQRAFAQELIANIRHYSQALSILNWLAASAGQGLCSRPIENWHMASKAFIGLLDRLRETGLALVNRNCLVFSGEAERSFVNGGWLQDYVCLTVESLRDDIPAIQDFESELVIGRENGLKSELDAAFLLSNRLHLIECRAKKIKKGSARTGAEAVHRLDELMELDKCLQARSLLLSYSPLREVDLRRLQLIGVKVLQEKQLQNLRSHLEEWIHSE